ncbi:MAG TPA: hypothetical protein VGR62_00920 [Candidatus Binatia bacterium]|jgi:hypothetical protein|nr:hypothetical protein [Candidatus Binatia bacterium]
MGCTSRWIVAIATMLVAGSISVASAVCPTPVGFAFVDLDGNLCHDPSDSGDVGPLLLDATTPFTPAAGSLVCPPTVRLNAVVTTSDGQLDWTLPGSAIVDCAVRVRRQCNQCVNSGGLFVDAGDRIEVGAEVRVSGPIVLTGANGVHVGGNLGTVFVAHLTASSGDVTTADRVMIGTRPEIEAGGDVHLGDRTTTQGATIHAAGSIVFGDRVRMKEKYFAPIVAIASADFLVGDGVSLMTKEEKVQLAADATLGVFRAERMSASGRSVDLSGGTIELGPGTTLRSRMIKPLYPDEGMVDLHADAAIDADGVRIDAPTEVHLTVASGAVLRFTNGLIRGDGSSTATFTTPPGGTCDVTGTTFDHVTPVFVGCTPVGP